MLRPYLMLHINPMKNGKIKFRVFFFIKIEEEEKNVDTDLQDSIELICAHEFVLPLFVKLLL